MHFRVIACVASLLIPAGVALAQFKPTTQPATTSPESDPNKPQTPLPPAAGAPENSFPGPHGTQIHFPTGLYDENAIATEQISKATKQALEEGKRILIMWGENKCGFCVFLNDILVNDAVIGPLVKTEFVWIKIDIGKFDRNIDLAQLVCNTPIMDPGFGAPALTILDPKTQKAVAVKGGNAMTAKPMQLDNVFDAKVIREFLLNNLAPRRVAQTVFNDSAAKAKGQGRLVFTYFVVPLCDACDPIDRWVSRPEVAPVLSRGFDIARIDTERMIGGRTILNSLSEGKIVAAPFIAIANAEGELAAPAATFAGLPNDDAEIKRFVDTMLKLSPKLTPADRDVLVKGIAEANATPATMADKK